LHFILDRALKTQATSSAIDIFSKPYVLITQSEIKIECFRVNAEGNWVSQTYRQGDELELMSIDFRCPIAQVYQKVPGMIL
ncbi:hypothetical protein QUA40_25905, partial [Microcoleus sp. Pol11C3]